MFHCALPMVNIGKGCVAPWMRKNIYSEPKKTCAYSKPNQRLKTQTVIVIKCMIEENLIC